MSSTVDRATKILELIAESPQTTQQVAEHFGMHTSTIFRQMQTLERAGFLLRHSDGTFHIGPRIISIAQQALDNLDVRRIAHEPLRALHAKVGNTIHLAQLVENQVIYIDKIDDSSGIRMYSRVGLPVRLNCTGVGKVILAQLSPAIRDVLLRDADWTAHTSTTLTRDGLDHELERIVERGWGVDDGEFEEFVNCVAAPITNSTGTVVAALSITALRVINDLDDLQQHVDDLISTTRTISRALG